MSAAYKFVSVMGYKVFSDKLENIPIYSERCRVANCSISPNNYGLATKDAEFKRVLQNTDFPLLDGVYFALASIFLLGKNIRRNQGPDVFKHFVTRMNHDSGRVFFLGSSPDVLQKITQRMKQDYPNIAVAAYSPPFKKVFTEEDNNKMVETINAFQPNILFVGMTAPKQEKWSLQHRDRLNCNLAISIGAVFDWYAGTQKSIHPFFFTIRMGWLARGILRPSIFKRDIGNKMIFVRDLILIILKIKKQPLALLCLLWQFQGICFPFS